MTTRYVIGAAFLLWTLMQTRMLMVYLGVIPSALGILGSPSLVFGAALSVISNLIRAILCFLLPSPALLPALTATLLISPIASTLAFLGTFGSQVAYAAHPLLSMLKETSKKRPLWIIRGTLLWGTIVCLLTAGLWYY